MTPELAYTIGVACALIGVLLLAWGWRNRRHRLAEERAYTASVTAAKARRGTTRGRVLRQLRDGDRAQRAERLAAGQLDPADSLDHPALSDVEVDRRIALARTRFDREVEQPPAVQDAAPTDPGLPVIPLAPPGTFRHPTRNSPHRVEQRRRATPHGQPVDDPRWFPLPDPVGSALRGDLDREVEAGRVTPAEARPLYDGFGAPISNPAPDTSSTSTDSADTGTKSNDYGGYSGGGYSAPAHDSSPPASSGGGSSSSDSGGSSGGDSGGSF